MSELAEVKNAPDEKSVKLLRGLLAVWWELYALVRVTCCCRLLADEMLCEDIRGLVTENCDVTALNGDVTTLEDTGFTTTFKAEVKV